MVVQCKVGDLNIRIINGYGPQECSDQNLKQKIEQFWKDFEQEIISAENENCEILIQMDANAKVGMDVIQGDPNILTENGKLLLQLCERRNFCILNSSVLCNGVNTRHRITVNGEEKSIIDYIIVSEKLNQLLKYMMIDDNRVNVLTK